ncbi:MAG TPA: hypothetical protein VES39_05235 [Rhodospirillales bacterium]|nr:hypothetical protein [Rhodospirillales bacterium]
MPQSVQPVLFQQVQRLAQFFADHQEARVGGAGRTLFGCAPAKHVARQILVLLDEVPVGDVLHAVHADAVHMEVPHPS